jgi:hypothetical protein
MEAQVELKVIQEERKEEKEKRKRAGGWFPRCLIILRSPLLKIVSILRYQD